MTSLLYLAGFIIVVVGVLFTIAGFFIGLQQGNFPGAIIGAGCGLVVAGNGAALCAAANHFDGARIFRDAQLAEMDAARADRRRARRADDGDEGQQPRPRRRA